MLIAYSFLAPNFVGFLIFTMIPVVFSILLAFLNWNGGGFDKISWAGLDNFAAIFKNFSLAKSDLPAYEDSLARAAEAALYVLDHGCEAAESKFNGIK